MTDYNNLIPSLQDICYRPGVSFSMRLRTRRVLAQRERDAAFETQYLCASKGY